jgi:hypothetical protein
MKVARIETHGTFGRGVHRLITQLLRGSSAASIGADCGRASEEQQRRNKWPQHPWGAKRRRFAISWPRVPVRPPTADAREQLFGERRVSSIKPHSGRPPIVLACIAMPICVACSMRAADRCLLHAKNRSIVSSSARQCAQQRRRGTPYEIYRFCPGVHACLGSRLSQTELFLPSLEIGPQVLSAT